MDPMSMLMMRNPQMLQALGIGGGGPPPNPPAMGGMPPGPTPPPNPPAISGMPPPQPVGAGLPPGGPGMNLGHVTMPGPGQGTPPGAMPNPAGGGDAVAGASNAGKPPNQAEPTGESPNQQKPQPALPHFPRNRFGAMLLPPGGQVGGGQQNPNPTQAFNWQQMLGQFLQKRGLGGQPGASGPAFTGQQPGGMPPY